jgi:tripartite-type tricarboxylate transporter receptor subunit TctC
MFARFWQLAVALLTVSISSVLQAQSAYPDRPIRVIVPFAAGTATDVIGRAVAHGLNKAVGQAVVVDNKPGALGAIGTTEAARARPDGYTLLLGTSTSLSAGPQMLKQKPSYDAETDFIPIGRVAGVVFTLVVRPDLGVSTLEEFVDLARKRGAGSSATKPLSWGYANSANLAAGTVLTNAAKIEAIKVPYKGVPQMMQDILGGTVDFAIVDLANALPLVKSGRLLALAVTTTGEVGELAGVPPMSRVAKDFQLMVWAGLFAPRGTPEPVVGALSDALKKAVADPEIRSTLERAGNLMFYGDRAEMRAYLKEDIGRWAELIKLANIQPE